VVYTLIKTGQYKVISIDNHHNSLPASLSRVSALALSELKSSLYRDPTESEVESTKIDAHTADLTSSSSVNQIFSLYGQGGIWGVVHIAAFKAVGESTQIPLTYYANNVSATLSLLQVMTQWGCRRIVYSSSATVYGTPPEIPIKETTRREPESPYGKTKVACEWMIEDLCTSTMNGKSVPFQAISLRYFNPAGAHPSGLVGEDPKGRPGNLLPLLAHIAVGRIGNGDPANEKSILKVFGDDYPTVDGTCVRDYLHVLDLAGGHVLALEALDEEGKLNERVFKSRTDIVGGKDRRPGDAKFKAYNLGKGIGVSVLEIVEAMKKATGFQFRTEVIGRRAGDVPYLIAEPTLAQTELGFSAPRTLDVMCADLWRWQKANPQGYDA